MPVDSPRDILQRHGLRPKHSWGQNFLGDDGRAARTSRDAARAGARASRWWSWARGWATSPALLLATGARVTAVERDRDMVARAREGGRSPA